MHYLFLHLQRRITAERLLLEVIAVYRVRSRPAAAADVDIFAGPAPSLIFLEIPEVPEKLGVLPYLFE